MQNVKKMVSGNLMLVIKDPIGLESFFDLADNWAKQHGATIVAKAFDFDVQLLEIEYQGELFYLATDVWTEQFTLESRSETGDSIIREMAKKDSM